MKATRGMQTTYDLVPRIPPPQCRRASSYLSEKLALAAWIKVAKAWLSSDRTSCKVTTAAVFL